MKTGLAALIHPYSVTEFLDLLQKEEPLVVHHEQKDHIQPLLSLPFLASLQALLKSWPSNIQVHLPDVRDESSSVDTTPADAQKLFDNGMGLLFREVQNISPLLKDWLQTVQKDLGLSALTYGRCLVYATPKGKGTAPHFDQNINLVLQVHGEKTWFMAPNHQLKNPLTRYTMGSEVDPEMAGYLETPMPTEMPKDARALVLKPGSLLYVPRGCWHATSAQEDALSLNFTFTAPTWIDLFLAALRSRLALSPEWRETAHGVADPHRRSRAEDELDVLLLGLMDDMPDWMAEDILMATEGPAD